jgi:ABC-type Fe3+-hydroxamate transport system substrate-binding protein
MQDDLGHPVAVSHPARRVVSVVPSLTEAVASVDASSLVGATDWCTHPPQLEVRRVRGTKNPDVRAIVELAPDLVIANQEENRSLDVERLRAAGIQVWVTRIETLDEAFASLHRLFAEALGWTPPPWLADARDQWSSIPLGQGPRVLVPIWRDPWMVVGPRTFTASLLARLGCEVLPHDAGDRYPSVDVGVLDALGADLVLLPDEPYVFTDADGPEAFPATRSTLVSGRMLTWYGPSLLPARDYLEQILHREATGSGNRH